MRLLAAVSLLVATPAWADTTVASKVFFGPSSYGLSADGEVAAFLDRVADAVEADPSLRLRLEVHADERPGTLDNTLLADKRAKELLKALKKRGVKKKKLGSDAIGHSGVQPSSATSRIVFDFSNDASVDVPPAWR